MEKFYGNDIEKIKYEYLLKATPFIKDTRINFSQKLTEDSFFEYLYVGKTKNFDMEINRENDKFDKDIEEEIRCINNQFAKVDLIHIAGYGGCGKTTYVRHLLWKIKKEQKMKENQDVFSEIIDYEGAVSAEQPFVERIASCIFKESRNLDKITNYLRKLARKQIFSLNRFSQNLSSIERLAADLEENKTNNEKNVKQKIENVLEKQKKYLLEDEAYLYYLLFLDFALQFYFRFHLEIYFPSVILIDNVDSLSNLGEEKTLVSVLKGFINDCNFFCGENIDNETLYEGKKVSDIIENYKVVFFLTTRMVTIKRFLELEPDFEKVYGWVSFKMPEHYYNHKEIIYKRIDYYVQCEGTSSETIKNLICIKKFANIVYRSYNFKRLFNGNIRFCIDTLCKIFASYSSTSLLIESMEMEKQRYSNQEILEGENGIILSLVLNYFKDNGIYNDKLHLSECQRDNKISLSRIILTVIREKGGTCSLLELFRLLSPFFLLDDICNVVWDLSEAKREYWRRLITFDVLFPREQKELYNQAQCFREENFAIEKYSEINICRAGLAYLDYVVPHFEFMLSRHKYGTKMIQDEKYQPLFSKSSERIIRSSEPVYRFERRIDWVFHDVEDCCVNSTFFAKKVMDTLKIDKNEYINNTFFNYHTVNKDGTIGFKQSYESRLIFSHVGYIERYRRYLLQKNENNGLRYALYVNEKLVERIKKYLCLYKNEELCFQTISQDEAANKLLNQIAAIEASRYYDFHTKIEIAD